MTLDAINLEVSLMRFFVLLVLFTVAGCAMTVTNGHVEDVRGKTLLLNLGDSKSKVIDILGNPGDRSFRDNDEAWQYCTSGHPNDNYSTIWFKSGFITGVTSRDAGKQNNLYGGSCFTGFVQIDWGQVPADKTIDLNLNK